MYDAYFKRLGIVLSIIVLQGIGFKKFRWGDLCPSDKAEGGRARNLDAELQPGTNEKVCSPMCGERGRQLNVCDETNFICTYYIRGAD